MHRKSLTIEEMDDAGKGLARIATLSAVDNDGDTYAPGAFGWKAGGHQWSQILPAHDWRGMPLGKARVFEEGDTAFADFQLNLEHQPGRDWHATLKFDLATGEPIQEWSYGYNVLDFELRRQGADTVRLLKRLDVFEVSPVLRGAGIGTRTLALKYAALKGDRFAALIGELGELADVAGDDPATLSATGMKQLSEIHDTLGAAIKRLAGESPDLPTGDLAFGTFMKFLARRHLVPIVLPG